jgi:hypothetical protein
VWLNRSVAGGVLVGGRLVFPLSTIFESAASQRLQENLVLEIADRVR